MFPQRAEKRDAKVFISSTTIDLRPQRELALEVARSLHLTRIVMEDFEAGSPRPPLDECLHRIRQEADVLVVILARRYGWVPSEDWPDLPEDQHGKSVTWLECIEAMDKGIDVIPVLLDEKTEWSEELIESNRSEDLSKFRRWLSKYHYVKAFSDLETLRDELTRALDDWKSRDPSAGDPRLYFDWIEAQAERTVASPGVTADPTRIYVPLSEADRAAPISAFLSSARLIIAGDPGSGKSTLAAKHALDLASAFRNAPFRSRLPLLLPGDQFWNHVRTYLKHPETDAPASERSPDWISHFFAVASEERQWGLSREFFRRLLAKGLCTVILDGFDQMEPGNAAGLFSEAARVYRECRFVITSRPWAVMDHAELNGFIQVRIAPLNNKAMRRLLQNWSDLSQPNPSAAQQHANAIYSSILEQPEVLRLARSPMVLQAIAVLAQKSGSLPDTRARLYEAMLRRLVTQRFPSVAGDPDPVEILQELAFRIQTSERSSATKRWGAEQLAPWFPGPRLQPAIRYIERQTEKTGVLTADGELLRFWHSTLQEFLAARWLANTSGVERVRVLSAEIGERLAGEAFREVLLFLAQLLQPEPEHLRALVALLLDGCERAATPASRACFAAALSSLNRTLAGLPDPLVARYEAIRAAYGRLFADGQISGIDFSSRLELARFACASQDVVPEDIEWIHIEGGAFWMGAQGLDPSAPGYDESAFRNEHPVHQVSVNSYSLSRYPVTVRWYARFLEEGGYRRKNLWGAGGFLRWSSPLKWEAQLEHPTQPVSGVSWYEAAAFCAWSGSRLPTEAEWERAAAGLERRRFPWGDSAPTHECANFDGRFGGVCPVGLFPEHATPEHVHDMAGNVWEWVMDGFGPYPESSELLHAPVGFAGSLERVLRGGCHRSSWKCLRSTERIHARPELRYTNFGSVGFRCARSGA